MEARLVRRSCDFCGDTQEFGEEQVTPSDAVRVQGWIILVRVFLVKGQTHPVQKHACKDSCAANIISLGMLDLPKEIKEMLAEEKRLADEFQKKLADLKKAENGSIGMTVAKPLPEHDPEGKNLPTMQPAGEA